MSSPAQSLLKLPTWDDADVKRVCSFTAPHSYVFMEVLQKYLLDTEYEISRFLKHGDTCLPNYILTRSFHTKKYTLNIRFKSQEKLK
jgi:hypothetical protein